MFKVCRTDANNKLVKLKKNRLYPWSWINMINPSSEEIEKVAGWVNWDVDILKGSLDIDERSRIEQDGKNFMVIVNLPLLDDEGQSTRSHYNRKVAQAEKFHKIEKTFLKEDRNLSSLALTMPPTRYGRRCDICPEC